MDHRHTDLPIYEAILSTSSRWFRINPAATGVLLGLIPLFVGWLLASILGTEEEFISVSLRLIYWVVIVFAFVLMHGMWSIWLQHQEYVARLIANDSERNILNIFSDARGQCLTAIGVMFIVGFFYVVLEPSIESTFVHWYVGLSLQLAAIAASFGVYFSIALILLVQRLSRMSNLNVLRIAPGETPGLISLSYLSAYWNIAYLVELLIILTGIILGPWGTSAKTFRLTLAGASGLISLWTVVNFFYIQYLIHRIVEIQELKSLQLLSHEIETHIAQGQLIDRISAISDLLSAVRRHPRTIDAIWTLVRGGIMALVPWLFVAASRWQRTPEILEFITKQLGLR